MTVSTQIDRANLTAERLASLKVGLVSGGTIGLICLLLAWGKGWGLGLAIAPVTWLWHGVMAGFSGFLFGITYRHIIRHDRDDHLQSGAVGAFGLVRGVAMLPAPQFEQWQPWLMAGLTIGESLLLFGLGRWVLDICFDRGWVQRFPMR